MNTIIIKLKLFDSCENDSVGAGEEPLIVDIDEVVANIPHTILDTPPPESQTRTAVPPPEVAHTHSRESGAGEAGTPPTDSERTGGSLVCLSCPRVRIVVVSPSMAQLE